MSTDRPATAPLFFPAYSRAERIADGAIHVLGIIAALIAVPVMIRLAAIWHGEMSAIAAVTIYGLSLIAMLGFSASYHMARHPPVKALLRRFDHGAIFVKIAGTWTPFAVLLGGGHAWIILIAIWSAAVAGLVLVLTTPPGFRWLSLSLYLAMGWAVFVLGGPLLEEMSRTGLTLALAGGGLYTLGVLFHLWDRLAFQNAIWHAHVLAATSFFYAAILVELASRAPAH